MNYLLHVPSLLLVLLKYYVGSFQAHKLQFSLMDVINHFVMLDVLDCMTC